jgi:hypothetical protein
VSPGDPTERLPCEGMIEEANALRARLAADFRDVVDLVDRHTAALSRCRERCWIRNTDTGQGGG